jgi:hypothetical protein
MLLKIVRAFIVYCLCSANQFIHSVEFPLFQHFCLNIQFVDYCPLLPIIVIIVQLLFIILIMVMYPRYFNPVVK